MKKVIKITWNVLQVLILIYVVIMTLFFLNKNRFGYTEIGNRVYVNVDKEISKEINNMKSNDLLVIRKNKEIDNDKNTYYYSSSVDKYIVKEGKITVDKNNAYYVDNSLISSERIIGSDSFRIPLVGGFLQIIENKVGFVIFVFLPIFLVFIYQVHEFITDSNKEKKKVIESTQNNYIDDEII